MIKQCEICGKDFAPKTSNQVYCCAECRKASQRSTTMRFCAICGTTVKGSHAKYCPKCRDIANRKKRHERYAKEVYTTSGRLAGTRGYCSEKSLRCSVCKFFSYNTRTCDYLLITKQPRGCKVRHCTKWEEKL